MDGKVYPLEVLPGASDDGQIVENAALLEASVVGHRITRAEELRRGELKLVLDNGTAVILSPTYDCCAHTELNSFLLHPEMVDHIITGVGTEGKYTTWHVYADMGDVLDLNLSWSAGNPFYYGYGFYIEVVDAKEIAQ